MVSYNLESVLESVNINFIHLLFDLMNRLIFCLLLLFRLIVEVVSEWELTHSYFISIGTLHAFVLDRHDECAECMGLLRVSA